MIMMSDFASALRALMDERDISQRALARKVPCDRAYVCRLANGTQRPSRRVALLLDDLLGAGGELAALAAPPAGGGIAEPLAVIRAAPGGGLMILYAGEEDNEDPVKRRAFLLDLAALAGIAHADPAAALEAARHGLNSSIAEERASADVSEWHEIAMEYGEAYLITAPAELLDSLGRDLVSLRAALARHGDEATARELYRAAALLAAFTAQTIGNLGHVHETGRWWRTARAAAGRAGDPQCALWIRGREIVRAMDHRPATAVLRLVAEAEPLASQAPGGAAELLAGKAQTLALAGGRQAIAASITTLPAADYILITDIHGDHMAPAVVDRLKKPGTVILAPQAVAEKVAGCTVISNGETKSVGDFKVEAIAMYNLKPAPNGTVYHGKGRGNGYVLTYGGKRFYFSGDSEGTPEMRAFRNIDVAFVCMNLPYTMAPEAAAEAACVFHPAVVYPYHYSQSDLTLFSKPLAGSGIDVRIRDWYPK